MSVGQFDGEMVDGASGPASGSRSPGLVGGVPESDGPTLAPVMHTAHLQKRQDSAGAGTLYGAGFRRVLVQSQVRASARTTGYLSRLAAPGSTRDLRIHLPDACPRFRLEDSNGRQRPPHRVQGNGAPVSTGLCRAHKPASGDKTGLQ